MAYRAQEEPLSQVMKSIENLDVTSMRPDIQKAKDANAAIKSKLVYRDEEELDTGVQKVQPLPYLDEEIQKYHAQIRESVADARRVNDGVPSKVLQRVDQATALAKEGMTSLFKASQLLEFTFDAYQYARGAAQDQYDLARKNEQHLAEFEKPFKNMIHYRINAEIPQAKLEFEKCQEAIECALKESREDVSSQELRAEHEDAVVQETSLRDNHSQVQEMVRMERSELNTIGDQCLKDMRSIDEELTLLRRHMTKAKQQYGQEDDKRMKRLHGNREEQRRLEERLRVLREEEERLVRDGETGVELQKQAEAALLVTEQDVVQWRSRIEELKTRTDTSLSIMKCMEECTGIIMVDAKRRKASWKKKLQQLAVESHWMLRESLLVKGAVFMMVLEDNKNNATECKDLIAHYENEKISASQRGFEPRVNDIKRSIDQYTSARAECEDKIADSSEKIKVVREELVTLDEKLHALRPALKLDTLENRYDELQQQKTKAFSNRSTDGITFSFYHKLPR